MAMSGSISAKALSKTSKPQFMVAPAAATDPGDELVGPASILIGTICNRSN
jgi:hypothetical protein